MRFIGWSCVILVWCLLEGTVHGQIPPPNDTFLHRINLSGSDEVFKGTLAGATLDSLAEKAVEDWYGATQSVWWTWTAPATTVLNLEFLSCTRDVTGNCNMQVFAASNSTARPDIGVTPPVRTMILQSRIQVQTASLPVSKGERYHLQLIGNNSAEYQFRIVATNSPVIFRQPRSQCVYSNDALTFYVIASGLKPLSYQWQFNGTNLDGETAPVLAITNAGIAQAGEYTVVVTNSTGVTVSEPATLSISQGDIPTMLRVEGMQGDAFEFSLTGENGRSYRIQTSSNLVDWVDERMFPVEPCPDDPTSLIFNSNSPIHLVLTNRYIRGFVRSVVYHPDGAESQICINNLRQICIAKALWFRDEYIYVGPISTPTFYDIAPYLPHPFQLSCPYDGESTFYTSYTMGNSATAPVCKIRPQTHLLEEIP